jgi:hypothetical protein
MGTVSRTNGALGIALLLTAALVAGAQTEKSPPTNLPPDIPKDCPIYPNAAFRDYQPMIRNRKKIGNVLVLDAPVPQEAVVEFYRKALPENGWRLKKHPKNPLDSLEGEKDGRTLAVGIVATRVGANPSTTLRLEMLGKH